MKLSKKKISKIMKQKNQSRKKINMKLNKKKNHKRSFRKGKHYNLRKKTFKSKLLYGGGKFSLNSNIKRQRNKETITESGTVSPTTNSAATTSLHNDLDAINKNTANNNHPLSSESEDEENLSSIARLYNSESEDEEDDTAAPLSTKSAALPSTDHVAEEGEPVHVAADDKDADGVRNQADYAAAMADTRVFANRLVPLVNRSIFTNTTNTKGSDFDLMNPAEHGDYVADVSERKQEVNRVLDNAVRVLGSELGDSRPRPVGAPANQSTSSLGRAHAGPVGRDASLGAAANDATAVSVSPNQLPITTNIKQSFLSKVKNKTKNFFKKGKTSNTEVSTNTTKTKDENLKNNKHHKKTADAAAAAASALEAGTAASPTTTTTTASPDAALALTPSHLVAASPAAAAAAASPDAALALALTPSRLNTASHAAASPAAVASASNAEAAAVPASNAEAAAAGLPVSNAAAAGEAAVPASNAEAAAAGLPVSNAAAAGSAAAAPPIASALASVSPNQPPITTNSEQSFLSRFRNGAKSFIEKRKTKKNRQPINRPNTDVSTSITKSEDEKFKTYTILIKFDKNGTVNAFGDGDSSTDLIKIFTANANADANADANAEKNKANRGGNRPKRKLSKKHNRKV